MIRSAGFLLPADCQTAERTVLRQKWFAGLGLVARREEPRGQVLQPQKLPDVESVTFPQGSPVRAGPAGMHGLFGGCQLGLCLIAADLRKVKDQTTSRRKKALEGCRQVLIFFAPVNLPGDAVDFRVGI